MRRGWIVASWILVCCSPSVAHGVADETIARALTDARDAIAAGDYVRAVSAERVLGAVTGDAEALRLRSRILIAVDDLARLDAASTAYVTRDLPATRAASRVARGDLARLLLQWDAADSSYTAALSWAATSDAPQRDSAAAIAGRAHVLLHALDYDGARERFEGAIALDSTDARYRLGHAEALIRLGLVRDAIAVLRAAVAIAPNSEEAHYYLGNGYTDANYTELPSRCVGAFPSPADSLTQRAMAALATRAHAHADDALVRDLRAFAHAHAGLAEPWALLGALEWARGEPDSAIARFRRSLACCPDYGRAHNGLAKSLERKRLAADVHAAANESLFAAAPVPAIDGIERFVVNYGSLTPRQQKSVALSIAPWAQFVPVLVASGATYYIKPLDQRLSESPHTASLRDQRIDYDSRLWDDVRGCGGHHTVTGAEDVERTILGRYNTVLHELSHQVHGVLPPDVQHRIDDLYAAAKARKEAGADAFVSRYQSGSVYEYFAEGMNSYATPRRDAYDVREITRERLTERDPALVALIDSLAHVTDVERCFAPALASAANSDLYDGDLAAARVKLADALRRAPEDETILTSHSYALLLAGSRDSARSAAEAAVRLHPTSADAAVQLALVDHVAARDVRARIATLERLRPRVRAADAHRIDTDLAEAYVTAGRVRSAREAAARALAHQADDASALWTLGNAHSLGGQHAAARGAFRRAIAVRNGIVPLRMDYAAALIRAGDFAAADSQLAEARLLAPRNAHVKTIAGWLALERGQVDSARTHLDTACAIAPWSDLATILRASAYLTSGTATQTAAALAPLRDGLPPSFVYVPDESTWILAHTRPAAERVLLAGVLSRCAALRGDRAASARLTAESLHIVHDD